MKEHKHAEVFLAAARGEAEEWEAIHSAWEEEFLADAKDRLTSIYLSPENWTVRRKQKTHVVNGFTVPEPLRVDPKDVSVYYFEDPTSEDFYGGFKWGAVFDKLCMERGIAHATKEGAIANCKARLGIDPYKDES